MFNVHQYQQIDLKIWNEFVRNSKNAHFFFYREYMDYHSDNFIDNSLMIYDDKGLLVCLLAANKFEGNLISHQGLTFGGFLFKSSIKQSSVLKVMESVLHFLKNSGFLKFQYKRIPYIYHQLPSDEDLYALFRFDFTLYRRDVSSSINLSNQISYSKGRKWLVKKAKNSNLKELDFVDVKRFWAALTNVISQQHGVEPVHSFEQISSLHSKFPKNIIFHAIELDNNYICGAVIFKNNKTVHTQYLFNTEVGRELGALDFLIDELIKNKYSNSSYFDFGISNENQGVYLNEGLISQKEGFGARAICHDFYEKVL